MTTSRVMRMDSIVADASSPLDFQTVLASNSGSGDKCEKYSLRPRASANKRDEDSGDSSEFQSWKPRAKSSKRRAKQKPAPLSKYRRKTANARERCRMREINEGFEALRRVLPHLTTAPSNNENNNNEKLTKISTLRLAMKYISALNRILHDADGESDDAESFLSEYTLTPPGGGDMSDQAFTPPTFSDHSLSTDFSDHLLSPPDFSSEQYAIPPPSSSSSCSSISFDGFPPLSSSSTSSSSSLSLPSLVNNNDFSICDFMDSALDSTTLAGCLPEISFDDTAYMFDVANF